MPATRRRTHAAIAAWLVDHDDPRRPRVTRLTDLGHHVYEAGDRAGALRLSVEAADAAMGVFAFGEAQIKYECALDLWEDLPDPETVAGISRIDLLERAADAAGSAPDFVAAIALNRALLEELGPDGDPARRTRRYDRLAWCQWDLGEADAAERTLREAMATMPVDEPRWRARLLAALAQLHWSAAKYLDGVAAAREALATAQAAGDPHEEGWARMILGANLAGSGDAATGVEELELAAGLLERDDAIDNVFAELTWALQLAGRHDDAVELAITAIERADRTGSQRRYVPYFLSNLCDSLDQLGRYAEIGHYLSTVDWPRDGGRSSSWLFQNLVTFHAAQGDLDAARAAAEAARARLPDGAARIDWFWQQFTETELALAEGRLEDAHRLAHAAIDASHDPAHDALLWRFLVIACQVDADLAERLAARRAASARMAELVAAIRTDCAIMDSVVEEARLADRLSPMLETYACRVAAEATRAEGHSDPGRWASASAAAERAGLRPDLAYARFREAEAWLARDHDAGRAAVALGLARQVAVEMGAAPLVARVDDLARRARLDHIGAATAAQTEEPLRVTVDDPWGLSAREREVLTLLGDGMTNRQIGEALFISEKTASVHVTHILTKLGVSSRTEAALLAQRAGDMTSRSPAP
jgi:DNA-binding CsgD family transcriptional regulator/tetratricopeptide (TPR) repeat protein